MIRMLVKSALDRLGYEIHRKQSAEVKVGVHPSYLSRLCQPRTVIDVGVGYGSYPLYKAFPKAHFILVEPLKEYEESINQIMTQYDCEIHYMAVGNEQGALEIDVDTIDLQKSSFVRRTPLTRTGNPLEKRTVEVTTLDAIFRATPNMEGPILLKIDTEGHELSALEGAKSLLQVTDVVIAEVSIAKRFEDSYEFEDIVSFMNKSGFYLFSFLTIYHPNGEVRPRFADVVFKRRSKETL